MKQKEILIISLTLFITICGWIIADIYHLKTSKSQIVQEMQLFLKANKIHIEHSVFPELLLRK